MCDKSRNGKTSAFYLIPIAVELVETVGWESALVELVLPLSRIPVKTMGQITEPVCHLRRVQHNESTTYPG